MQTSSTSKWPSAKDDASRLVIALELVLASFLLLIRSFIHAHLCRLFERLDGLVLLLELRPVKVVHALARTKLRKQTRLLMLLAPDAAASSSVMMMLLVLMLQAVRRRILQGKEGRKEGKEVSC